MLAQPEPLSLVVAFLAGLAYFLSPCVLPLIPSYLSYMTGISVGELKNGFSNRKIRLSSLIHSLLFILGFSIIFIILGLSASFLGEVLSEHLSIIRKVGGIFIIFLGLLIAGWLKIPFLMRDKHLRLSHKTGNFFNSFLIGISFAAGWTACSTPILASILIYTSCGKTTETGAVLLTAFSMGLAVPFILTSLLLNSFMVFFKKINKHLRTIEIISGLLLIIFGGLIFTNWFSLLSAYFVRLTSWQGI